MKMHRGRTSGWTVALAAALALACLPARAAPVAPAYAPPETPPKACRSIAPVDLGIDWTGWTGGRTDRSRDDLLAIAGEYATGSARVGRDAATAARILAHLRSLGADDVDLAAVEARSLLASGDAADRQAAIVRLRSVMAAGSRSAGRILGDTLSGTDPAGAADAYRAAASAGDPRAAIALARILSRGGDRAAADLAVINAFTAVLLAIADGDCRAARLMVSLYSDGDLVEPRRDLAAAWSRFAADLGDASSAIRVARAYHLGIGMAPDEGLAIRYLEIAAKAGRSSALLSVGSAYATGAGVAHDGAKAADYLERAARAGKEGAWALLAQLHRGDFGDPPSPDKAYAALVAAAAEPNAGPVVFLELGRAELAGSGTTRDPAAAFAHLVRAAEAGSSTAAFEAGRLVEAGDDGLEADIGRALRLYRLAAAGGSAPAANQLSQVFRCGGAVERSVERSAVWLERAAFLGSSSSMRKTASKMLVSDDPAERERGFLMLRQAARRGDLDAVAAMAIAAETGENGATRDAAVAARWTAYGRSMETRPGEFDLAFAKARMARGIDGFREAEGLFRTAIDAGLVDASFELARALDLADLAEPERLVELLLPPARAGFVPAIRKLGELLGAGGSAGGRSGTEWLQAAADAGDFSALLRLAGGLDGDRLRQELVRLDTGGLACDADDFAKLAVAWLRLGPDGRDDANRLAELAAATAGSDDGPTLLAIARVFEETGSSPARARRLLERAVAAGEPKALRLLAEGLAAGRFGPPEPAEAVRVLLAGGDAGDHDADIAFLRLTADGTLLADGADIARVMERIGGELDSMGGDVLKIASRARDGVFGPAGTALARDWLERAAASGRTAAMRMLADICLYGTDSERNPDEGLAWLEKAADAGDREALRTLSAAYDVGFVVDVDRDRAQLLRETARRQSAAAADDQEPTIR